MFPHGGVGAAQGVGDDDVQDASSGRKDHLARGAHGSWREETREELPLPSVTHHLIHECKFVEN